MVVVCLTVQKAAILLAIREMEIKITVRYHYASIRMSTVGTAPNVREEAEGLDHSNLADGKTV